MIKSLIVVTDVRSKNASESLRQDLFNTLQQLGVLDTIFYDKTKRVLLKPNLVYPRKSGSGIITDRRIVIGLIEILQDLGFSDITVGEGSAVGYDFVQNYDTYECMKAAELDELPRRYGVKLVDFNRDEPIEIDVPNPLIMERVKIARTALESDIIINLPVMKTHIRTGITAGLKNMKGVLPGSEKKKTHRLGLEEAIADLNTAVKVDLTLVDGIVGMEGNWDYPRDCVSLGIIMGSTDPVALDATCSRIMGFDPYKIRYISYAEEKKLGVMDSDKIEFVGLKWDEIPKKNFKPRFQSFVEDFPGVNVIDDYACTGCYSTILSTLAYINRKGFKGSLNNLNLVLAVNDNKKLDDLKGETFIIGTCNATFNNKGVFIPGCPPKAPELIASIKQVFNLDFEVDFDK